MATWYAAGGVQCHPRANPLANAACHVRTALSDMMKISLAASVAPEDLRCGDSVAILSLTREYPSFFWCSDAAMMANNEPVRVSYMWPDGGVPLKIKAICLPFVFV